MRAVKGSLGRSLQERFREVEGTCSTAAVESFSCLCLSGPFAINHRMVGYFLLMQRGIQIKWLGDRIGRSNSRCFSFLRGCVPMESFFAKTSIRYIQSSAVVRLVEIKTLELLTY